MATETLVRRHSSLIHVERSISKQQEFCVRRFIWFMTKIVMNAESQKNILEAAMVVSSYFRADPWLRSVGWS